MARPPSIRLALALLSELHTQRLAEKMKGDPAALLSPNDSRVLRDLAAAEVTMKRGAPEGDKEEGGLPRKGDTPAAIVKRLKESAANPEGSQEAESEE